MEREEFVAIWVGDPGAFFVWQETHLDELHDVLVAELDDVVDLVFNDVYHDVHLSKGLLPSTELPRNKIWVFLDRIVLIQGRPEALLIMQNVEMGLSHII